MLPEEQGQGLSIELKPTIKGGEMTGQTAPLQIQDRENVLAADDGIEWRYGKRPDYSKTDKTLRTQSERHHPKGSLEDIVQNLVRTFEMGWHGSTVSVKK